YEKKQDKSLKKPVTTKNYFKIIYFYLSSTAKMIRVLIVLSPVPSLDDAL
ncbi:MAG: hypothetical protein ACI9RZ_002038, partial [Sphingobacteriales bacterium]